MFPKHSMHLLSDLFRFFHFILSPVFINENNVVCKACDLLLHFQLSGWTWYTCLWWGPCYKEYQGWCNPSLETSEMPKKDSINWITSPEQSHGILLCEFTWKRYIVLFLTNYLLFWFLWNFNCSQMVDFVREGFLGSSHEFRNRQDFFTQNLFAVQFRFVFFHIS